MTDFSVVPLTAELISGVAEIEQCCFPMPWSEKSLMMLTNGHGCGFAVLCDGIVAAYGGMLCVLDEAQITNIATLPPFRRQGFAKAILNALCKKAADTGAVSITLEVRESNSAARRLYSLDGFSEIGYRPDYYFKPREAAVIMEKKL